MPEYEHKLVSRSTVEVENKVIMDALAENTVTTYKVLAITVDGEQKAIVETEEEAEKIVNTVKEDLDSKIDLKLGIVEIYTQDYTATSEEKALEELNTIKVAKVEAYKKEKAKALAKATAPKYNPTGNISGIQLSIPVIGKVTSRFGARSSSRSSAHTGVDICTSKGTGISPIASGTVTYAAYKGSYGNLIIIDHGNGIESYYAHCNDIYVSQGQYVDSNTTIGTVGTTGNSTGPHLHLEIRINGQPINPQNYLY